MFSILQAGRRGHLLSRACPVRSFNHVLINPPVDRKKPVYEVGDVFVHVVKERDDGIVVRGTKMLATGSAPQCLRRAA